MPKGKPIDPTIKRRALKALKVPGSSIAQVAAELKIAPGNLRRWTDSGNKGRKVSGNKLIALLRSEAQDLEHKLQAIRTTIDLLQ